jgi:hypothetical protein
MCNVVSARTGLAGLFASAVMTHRASLSAALGRISELVGVNDAHLQTDRKGLRAVGASSARNVFTFSLAICLNNQLATADKADDRDG